MSADLLQVQFQGVDEGADPKALPPGALLVAENCAMDKARRIVKRDGTEAVARTLVSGSSITAGTRLQTRGSDLSMNDGEYTLSYSPDLSKWQQIGRPSPFRGTYRSLVDVSTSVPAADVAASGNLLVTFFQAGYSSISGTSVCVQVENIDTGANVLIPRTVSTNARMPRVLIDGTNAYLVFHDTSASLIKVSVLDLTTMTFTSPTTIGVTTYSTTGLDACIATATDGKRIYVSYTDNSGGANLWRVSSLLIPSLTSGVDASYASTIPLNAIGMVTDGSNIHIVASQGAPGAPVRTTYLMTIDASTLTASVGPTSIYGGTANQVWVAVYNSTELLVGYTRNDLTDGRTEGYRLDTGLYLKSSLGIAPVSERITYPMLGPSKPFSIGGRWYCACGLVPQPYSSSSTDSIPNASTVVVEIETGAASLTGIGGGGPHNHAATLENQTGWFPTGSTGFVPQVVVSGSTVCIPSPYRNAEPQNLTSIPIGWNLHKLEIGGDTHKLASIGRSALSASAAPAWLEGGTAMPVGFQHAPIILSVTPTAGGSMVAGVYGYVAVYEWRDSNGVLHRSIPSPVKSGTTSGGNLSLQVKVACSMLSNHVQWDSSVVGAGADANPVEIAIYRTTVNGSILYRLTRGPSNSVLKNAPTIDAVTLTDTKADSDIGSGGGDPAIPLSSQEQLYTSTGQLDDAPPPSLVTVVTHGGRLAGLDGTLRTVWFSKDSTDDPTVAPGFNAALTVGFANDKIALASLDEKFVALGENGIDVVFGTGPDATGAGATWQTARVQTDVGCTNPRTATTPMGVCFVSQRGIELLTRDLTVSWIGKPVQDTLATYPTITSAVLVPSAHEVRFTCNKADGSAGIVLAWDYFHRAWFTRKYTDAANTGAASVPFVDAAVIDGVYTLLTSAGVVYQETSAHKLDNGTGYVETDVQLAPLCPGGNIAWKRVKDVTLLGSSVSKHKIEISQCRDFATSWEAAVATFDENSPATAIGSLDKCRRTFPIQKCQAMQVRIRDLAPTNPADYGTGEGHILDALAFRVAGKRGPAKTSATEQQ